MRVSKIRWVSHSKFPILSVDVQPNGYRFITGGADSFVRVWNLMPVISDEHEYDGESDSDQEGGPVENSDMMQQQSEMSGSAAAKSKHSKISGKSKKKQDEDSKMADADDVQSDDGLTPEERAKKKAIEQEYRVDIELMEGLFQDANSKSKRLLAQLEGHSAPINCVRWNNLGTIFASADDEGTINLWQYRGKKILSAFQQQVFGMANSNTGPKGFEDAKAEFAEESRKKDESDEKDEMEDWAVLKRCRGHRGSKCDTMSY